ncbi:hypothetical protein EDB82DRAFT_331193 [Fusarium venenatum]|uniref:uncharacterized protein n=1 Tax=Fusarium venenatum TaxID=56646 RepID=UPI001DFB482A|nr:hypothetical protein EDB82DRAFT_331193 [Fusarium venenatum]
MRITLNIFNPQAGEQDSLLTVEIFPDMTLATLRESIQAESTIPPTSQHIYHNGRLISDDTQTMEQLQIADGEMLALHVRDMRGSTGVPEQARRPQPRRQARNEQDPELIRLQILGQPALRQQLQSQHPELASAVDDPARFAQIFLDSQNREQRERQERQREIERLNDDPFNIENQRKIEEMIRQERVMENLQNAMEHNPEVFGRVHMLYVDVEIKIGNLFLPCSFTVMEATIDLAKDKLCIQGEEVPFLGEAEIPKEEEAAAVQEPTLPGPDGTTIGQRSGAVVPPDQQQQPVPAQAAPPAQAPVPAPQLQSQPAAQPAAPRTNISPQAIESLVSMGATREQAIQALQAADGNPDVAASLIFF